MEDQNPNEFEKDNNNNLFTVKDLSQILNVIGALFLSQFNLLRNIDSYNILQCVLKKKKLNMT